GMVALNLGTGESTPILDTDPQERFALLAASRDGRRVVLGLGNGNRYNEFSRSRARTIDTWYAVRDTTTKEYLARVYDPEDVFRSAATSPDGTWLATAGGQGTIKLWDATTGREVRTLRSGVPPPQG